MKILLYILYPPVQKSNTMIKTQRHLDKRFIASCIWLGDSFGLSRCKISVMNVSVHPGCTDSADSKAERKSSIALDSTRSRRLCFFCTSLIKLSTLERHAELDLLAWRGLVDILAGPNTFCANGDRFSRLWSPLTGAGDTARCTRFVVDT